MAQILVVKTSSLGDVVHNLAAVSDIKAFRPDVTIDWVVEAPFAQIPALHPGVRKVIPVALRKWRKTFWRRETRAQIRQFVHDLRQTEYDYVMDPQGLFKSAVIAALAHGPVHGQDHASAREFLAATFYKYKYTVPRGRHAVERNRLLAAQVFGYDLADFPLDYGIGAIEAADKAGWLPAERYVVCLHGTSRPSKFWPGERWLGLLRELVSRGLTPVLPWGSQAEHERSRKLAAQVPAGVVPPPQDLRQLAGVIAGADAVIGVDTGLAHLAVALGRPTIALYTDTDPRLTGVYPMPGRIGVNLGGPDRPPRVEDVLEALGGIGLF